MPESKLDQQYVEQVIADIKDKQRRAAIYAKEHQAFIKKFPAELQAHIPYLALAQEEMQRAMQDTAHHVDHTKEQHPTDAVSGTSAPAGNCINALGEKGRAMGNTLVQRSFGSKIGHVDKENNRVVLNYDAAFFFELAKAKGVKTTIHMRTTDFLTEVLFYSYKHGAKGYEAIIKANAKTPEEAEKLLKFLHNPAVQNYIEEGALTYQKVVDNGLKHYEDMLVFPDDAADEDRKLLADSVELCAKEGRTIGNDERMMRALGMQQNLLNHELLVRSGHHPNNLITIYQGRITDHQYVWNHEARCFVVIPHLEPSYPDYENQKARFSRRLPEAFRSSIDKLMDGARYYRQMRALEKELERQGIKVPDYVIHCCSDSRSLTKFIVAAGAEQLHKAYRNPGARVSLDGELVGGAERSLAYCELTGAIPILAPHTNCGAQEAIDEIFNGKGKDLPPAFVHSAHAHGTITKTIWNLGETPDENQPVTDYVNCRPAKDVAAHFSRKTGIPLETVADSAAAWGLMLDYQIVKQEFIGLPLIAVCQNVRERTNHLFNKNTGKFEAIEPSAIIEFDPEPAHPACNCGGHGHGGHAIKAAPGTH
jgi:carbonic anhydrase